MEFFNRFSLTRQQPPPPQVNTPAQPISKPSSSRNVSWLPTTKTALTAAGILTGLGAIYFFYPSNATNPLPPVNVIPTPPPSTNPFEMASFLTIGTVLIGITACMCKPSKTSKNLSPQKDQPLPLNNSINDEESNSIELNSDESLDENSKSQMNDGSVEYRILKKNFDKIDELLEVNNFDEVDNFLNNSVFSVLLNKINNMTNVQEIREIRSRCLALKQKYPNTKTVVLDTCSTIIKQFAKDDGSENAEDSTVEVQEKEHSNIAKLLSQ